MVIRERIRLSKNPNDHHTQFQTFCRSHQELFEFAGLVLDLISWAKLLVCPQTIERILMSLWVMWIYGLQAITKTFKERFLQKLSFCRSCTTECSVCMNLATSPVKIYQIVCDVADKVKEVKIHFDQFSAPLEFWFIFGW